MTTIIIITNQTQFSNSTNVPHNLSFKSHRPELLHLRLLKRCSHLAQCKQIHTQLIKNPSHQTDFFLVKLIESLVNSSHIKYAHQLFEEMSEPTTFVFNTMVRGYTKSGFHDEAIKLYNQMQYQGLEFDNFTYPFLLKACKSLNQGKGVHSLILKTRGGLGVDVYSQTSLVSFYSSYGDLEYARSVFDGMQERNVVSWTAMITGYVKHKRYNEGLALFHMMHAQGNEINEFTLVNVLSACAHLGAFEMGQWVHDYIDNNRFFLNPTLATALVDMYVKCGHIRKASQVFEKLPVTSVCTWNSIIGGLAMHGCGDEALEKFDQMQNGGIRPDAITFIGILSACTHSGMVHKGIEYFASMQRDYGIEPSIKHYGCMVDLLGRAGRLDEAYEIVKNMPMEPNGVVWGTLLTACSVHGNIELAETALEHLVELEPYNDGNYILMANIYAAKGQWNNVATMRKFMKDGRIVKTPGRSLIVIDNEIHDFMVGDCRHPKSKEIYSLLDDVATKLKVANCVPNISEICC